MAVELENVTAIGADLLARLLSQICQGLLRSCKEIFSKSIIGCMLPGIPNITSPIELSLQDTERSE
jgi:hypothetical protein